MKTKTSFEELFSLLSSESADFVYDQARISIDESADEAHLKLMLQGIGYNIDPVRTLKNGLLTISLSATNWERQCPIFSNWETLFADVKAKSLLPEFFYVVSTKSSNFDEEQNAKRLNLLCKTRKLLAQLSDHCDPPSGPTKGSRKLIYVIETETSVVKHEFKPVVSWEMLNTLDNVEASLEAIDKLIKVINVGDSQDAERKNVLRSAFSELVSGCTEQSVIFQTVLRSTVELLRKYEAHHELFVKRFSVNKVLQEINDQDLKYTSKINEIVSSAQNKALTIPGALIAIGAIMRIDQVIDGIAVAIGMLVTTIIVHRSLIVHEATIVHINKQVKADFQRYNTLNEKAEVRSQANNTRQELTSLLGKASTNSSFIKKCIWGIFIAAILFISMSSYFASNGSNENGASVPVKMICEDN